MQNEKLRIMIEISMAVALSTILSFITLWRMPMGGSVNLVMLPIFLMAFRNGARAGILTGILYGAVRLMLGAYVVHPAQFLLDYPVAYGFIGIAGFFKIFTEKNQLNISNFIKAFSLAALGVFTSHLLSGVIFFADSAPAGQNPWVYSALYNITHVLPTIIITAIVVALISKRPEIVFLNYREKQN